MSLSLSLSNAVSGLTATSRAVSLVSNNVANALTEGYAPRELSLSSRSVDGAGAGVMIEGVTRRIDPVLIAERRLADAAAAGADTRSDALSRIEETLGDPTDEGSLTARLAAFEAALLSAGSRPDSTPRLTDAVETAKSVAAKINEFGQDAQLLRQTADAGIAADVQTINTALTEIAELDDRIFSLARGNRDITGLLDQRQQAIDRIAPLVPLREISREGGRIALISTGGAVLYDGRPAELSFTPRVSISPELTLVDGDLSTISLNGIDLRPTGASALLRGGALEAKFIIRDEVAPDIQAAVDSIARDLVSRFQETGLDPTLVAGDAGLFTDSGAAFVPANEVGLSQRLSVNARLDPDLGGMSSRLRDGIGAATTGPVGDASLLNALASRLSESRVAASGPFSGAARTSASLAADLLSFVSVARQTEDRGAAFESARRDSLRGEELRGGVDTDAEMQRLLVLEQAYAANARVISVLDDLMQTLLRI